MMIFLLALSMMIAMTASAIILLLEERASKRQNKSRGAISWHAMHNNRNF
ncbi:hypothetical protein ACI0FR_01455 [Paenochrobactrum sp. BZR 201-1]